ncbi:hypothetical protein [Haliangium ochraceum]|uniref:Outer membrane protein beta-barrel domain-containing protein n=1 Tax=Haliangium ochraceum (strain DSM 14365 / JCM 11303 / SMP-2) TaxID=502025 RepID=D0LKZ0_HALO1|nr:hypothetical protein [Haliangium ochraceum]ACY16710.1 hypothetical protein Hoch_4212 [Haliangium ochraceum DSM 14365]
MGGFISDLSFADSVEPEISEQSAVAAAGYRWGGGWSVRGAAGAILGGSLEHGERSHDIGLGWLVSASVSRNFSFAERWFASASFTTGVSRTSTQEQDALMAETVSLTATDLRLGGLVGVTLGERVSPYALARVFAAPVFWTLDGEDIAGSDQYHYQLGFGTSVRLPWELDLLLDVSLLGERSLSLGLSTEL